MEKISVFIITKNEAARIYKAIMSVKSISDEIIIIDSGSTDDTVKICEELGVKVIYNAWQGYLQQKIFGQSQCTNDWILNIDADEELSPALQDEIRFLFASNIQNFYKAYKIKLTIIHRLENKVRKFAPYNAAIRLYNKKFCGFHLNYQVSTHDSVTFNPDFISKPKIYTLNEPAYHLSGTSIEQLVSKANFYSSQQANDLIKLDRNFSPLRIICELFVSFFKAYIIRRYFIFGFKGLIDSIIFAFARFIRLAKVRELNKINLKNNNAKEQI